MAIDLSQFHQVFFEESFEGLDVMESALMELDPAAVDIETINAIFRAAHSIKGGSATFGFNSIAEFTHDLETILDQVRAGIRVVRGEDINIYLKSVDCMREMLGLLREGENGVTEQSQQLKAEFALMLSSQEGEESSEENKSENAVENTQKNKVSSWNVQFHPGVDILKTGNEVTRLFRELGALGKLGKVQCTWDIPSLKSMDPELCYLRWQCELIADLDDKTPILEVFEWVADEADLIVTPILASSIPSTEVSNTKDNESKKDNNENTGRWKIEFIPGQDILRTGNDPMRMFKALENFGELNVTCKYDMLPTMRLMDSESCFLAWTLELTSEKVSNEQIREIFEWVLDDAVLSILPLETSLQSKPATQAAIKRLNTTTPVAKAANVPIAEKPKLVAIDAAGKSNKPAATSAPKATTESSSIRVGIDKVDNLINMVGELVITQSMLGQLGNEFDVDRLPKLLEGLGQLEQNTRELQESVMRIRMLPISFAFSRFPRMVRDLGQALGKNINLQMLGEQTELDKTVMEKIGDPLVHLVRNAVDHGIEMPSERLTNGKSAEGNITLNAYHQGGNVVIEINDDGRGLDREKIVAKAIERGIISAADADSLSNEHVFDLIFQPGFSTAEKVSDVSGRGVGMDVVKRNIQALNGHVEIKSEKNYGSKITIRLPLTLAILDGQLVRVGDNTCIFSLVSIVESLQIKKEFISNVAGGCSVFKLRDDYVPIIELHRTFAVEPESVDLDQSLLVVVEHEGEKVGIVVDELMAQQQVVIKSLEQNYKRIDGISGATILGDGTVALILDVGGIVKLAGEKFNFSHRRQTNSLGKMPSNVTSLAG